MSQDDAAASHRATLTYTEAICPGLKLEMDLKKILASEESDFQKVEVLETTFGKVSCGNGS
jgi:spermidine synthase